MKIKANAIKAGNVLLYDGDLWVVTKQPDHTKPGKGGAYVKTELKNFKTNIKKTVRFGSTDNIEKIFIKEKKLNYLYKADEHLVLMDFESCEEQLISKDILDGKLELLDDGMQLIVECYEDDPIRAKLPDTVIVEIAETPDVSKGATATPSYKHAVLTNGLRVDVPPYLDIGEKILIRSHDLFFISRAK